MKEGFAFGAGLILVGLALQFSVGPVHWSDFAFPINAFFLFFYLLALVLVYVLRHRVRLFSFLFTTEAAVLCSSPHCGDGAHSSGLRARTSH